MERDLESKVSAKLEEEHYTFHGQEWLSRGWVSGTPGGYRTVAVLMEERLF